MIWHRRLRAAGFSRADRCTFRRASRKPGFALSAGECVLMIRYHVAEYERTGARGDQVTAAGYSIKLRRKLMGEP